ncbi:MAG: metallophosphoesterase [Clostridia bacterium]|nr:metallophosphoesterase [Clostridia bacterium]
MKQDVISRFLLVSDMHYHTQENFEELKTIYPEAKASLAAGDIFGHPQREKIEKVYEGIMAEHAIHPLDGVLVLGDLSIDDADYRKLPINYCQQFKIDCMDRLPCPSYAQPGNHDSHTNDTWREVFGYDREFTVEFGDNVFLMADSFKGVPATGASGAGYTKIDPAYLRGEIEKYKGTGKNLFLCSHHVGDECDEVKELIRTTPELKCAFRGHTHHDAVIPMGDDWGGKYLIDIGGYGYNGMVIDGKYTFSVFDFKWAWGYEILEITKTGIRLYHVKPAMHYEGSNGVFDIEHTVDGELELQ